MEAKHPIDILPGQDLFTSRTGALPPDAVNLLWKMEASTGSGLRTGTWTDWLPEVNTDYILYEQLLGISWTG